MPIGIWKKFSSSSFPIENAGRWHETFTKLWRWIFKRFLKDGIGRNSVVYIIFMLFSFKTGIFIQAIDRFVNTLDVLSKSNNQMIYIYIGSEFKNNLCLPLRTRQIASFHYNNYCLCRSYFTYFQPYSHLSKLASSYLAFHLELINPEDIFLTLP